MHFYNAFTCIKSRCELCLTASLSSKAQVDVLESIIKAAQDALEKEKRANAYASQLELI
jgi:hypothetical protein